jgi:hypothetical protein
MDSINEQETGDDIYLQLQYEKKAEELNTSGFHAEAVKEIQDLIDNCIPLPDKSERAYYLQEMARYAYHDKKSQSNDYQIQAYKLNRFLLKPRTGIGFQRLEVNKKRTENIMSWINQFDSYVEIDLKVTELLTHLSFGIKADSFEKALNEFGLALGFGCERPDKELKKGPDNLWNIHENKYILFECKNEVSEDRAEIVKAETGRMNNACAWFKTNYKMDATKYVMVIPIRAISSAAGFNYNVEILRKKGLNKLKNNFRKFFMEFETYDLKMITETQVEKYLKAHNLTVEEILSEYTEAAVQKK